MPTRRQFLRKAGYGLVLIGGPEWLASDAHAAPAIGRHVGPLAQAEVTHFSSTVRGERIGEPQLHGAAGITTSVADLWDGASGVTPDYFNIGALLPWQNRLGDWSDASGVAQGSKAFASGGAGSVGPFTMDLSRSLDGCRQTPFTACS